MNSIGCKFCPPATRFRGSDDVINLKFSHFPAQSAGLHLNPLQACSLVPKLRELEAIKKKKNRRCAIKFSICYMSSDLI